jgi:Zc3h12a-like Ribonuclease NYN domain/S1 RNA binding domain
MPHHVIVDGSNLATEGRTMPSLQQLNEAIASYRSDHPDVLMTVVVDATFGHRIDPKEVAAFEKAIDSNEFVAPPAGAVGRGDGFILNIAQKANASILSNDSYQEFHGEFEWLFDEGRLIGGKPVPHVGWVWVNRVPVRGPISRRSVKEGKSVDKQPGRRRGAKANDAAVIGSASANAPMPVPKSPPPGAVMPTSKAARDQIKTSAGPAEPRKRAGRNDNARNDRADNTPAKSDQAKSDHARNQQAKNELAKQADTNRDQARSTTNDLLAFLSFVEHFPVGTAVTGVVESYSSHGAYVAIGDVHGYVPLRLMADPAPRSAREAMDLGETVTLVVSSFGAARRSVDLAVPSMAPVVVPPPVRAKRGAAKAAAAAPQLQVIAEALAAAPTAAEPAPPTPVPRAKAPAKSGKSSGATPRPRPAKKAPVQPADSAQPAQSALPAQPADPVATAPSVDDGGRTASSAKRSPAKAGRRRAPQHEAAADIVVSPEARSRRQPRSATPDPESPVKPMTKQSAPKKAAPAPAAAPTMESAPAKKAAPRRRPNKPVDDLR